MLVCYTLSSGRTKEIVTLSTDTVIFLKTRIQGIEDVSPAHQRLTFAGKTLEDAHTLGYYGVRSGSTIRVSTTTEKRRSGRMSWVAGPSPQELGLVDLATAVALWDWDGHMAGNRQEGQTGLKLSQGETVTITKVVNEEWYQGCKDKGTVGYFPRSFVSVQTIAEPVYRDSFGSDGPQEETSQAITVQMHTQTASPHRWSLSNLLHGLQSFVSVFLCCGPRSHPARPGRPSLPPSPIPPSPAFDRSFGGSRFLIIFTCTPGSRGRYVLRAAMMLDPAEEDGCRFSSLRLNISLKSGTVLSMSEPIIDTTYVPPMMSARGSVFKGALSEEDEDDHRDAAPLLKVEAQDELDRLSAFSHTTTNAVHAQGAGSSNAQWVLKEDLINIDGDGDSKRRGLEPRIVLEAILDVRPAAVVFNVIVGTRVGDGKERAVQSGTLNGWL